MSLHDISLLLIYQVPALAFLMVAAATLALPVLHLLRVFGRIATGQEANINWWVIGRALPFGLAVIVAVPLIAVARTWTRESQVALAEVALIYLSVAMIFLPIALPLLQAYQQRLPRFGTFVYSVLAILALPVAAAVATQVAVWTTLAIGSPGELALHTAQPQALTIASQISSCQLAVFRVMPEGMILAIPTAQAGVETSYPAYFFFWADMTFKAVFLDFFEVFDCGITTVRHNPDHVLMSSFVFVYRSFVSLIFITVLTLPFVRDRA